MEIKNLTYLLLLLVFLVIPVILSIKNNVRFIFQLKYILPATIFTGTIFVMWDIRFTEMAIWSFNPIYLTGFELLKIPIEEWLSFLIIPLSTIYIYEWLKVKYEKFERPNIFIVLSLVILAITGILAYWFRARMFSFFTFFLTAIYLGYTIFRNRFKKNYTKFYLAWFISLVPFITFSSILNGLPAVIYNSNHIIGVAPLGVPIERIGYLFLLLLINITIYEYLNNRRSY